MTKIICECASSHNSDLELLKAMVKSAAENGCDIFKVQDYRAKNVPENDPDKARYEKYEFKDEWWPEFLKCCKENNIESLTTCFNVDRCKFLAGLGLKKIKLASISLANADLLMTAGACFEEVILSTGMASKEEVEEAIDILETNAHKFTVMVCTANYPTSVEDANLERINTLKRFVEDQEYASVGFSSHALDTDVPKMAIAQGIKYLEVHFSLSRYLPQIPHQMYSGGPMVTTHQVSLEPHELNELADWRDKVELMKGSGEFKINEVEQAIKSKYQNRYGL